MNDIDSSLLEDPSLLDLFAFSKSVKTVYFSFRRIKLNPWKAGFGYEC